MEEFFKLEDFDLYKEGNCREVKKAKGGLPTSIWETYSAFANTSGGVIILGVIENKDRTWTTAGLKKIEVDKMLQDFWNIINNPEKVNINLLSNKDVKTYNHHSGDAILVINVPVAKREQKPVYIKGNMFSGTFRRNGEGDYHCSESEVKAMLRDVTEDSIDMRIVEQFDISVIDKESLHFYRNRHKSFKPGHVFESCSDEEYLRKIGAVALDRDNKLHPTIAGLLMFGHEYDIVRELPDYFLDYRELLDQTIRWSDRLQSSSGDWTGNIMDFFFRVNNKIVKDIKIPFNMKGIRRIDDTPVHRVLREALVNCLVNADYFIPRGIVIKKEIDKIIIENPGNIRTGKEQMIRGGISDPRNKTLMKMFNLIGYGERAGSGVPDIFSVWKKHGWIQPTVEEEYSPNRTILSLSFKYEKELNIANNDKGNQINSDRRLSSKTIEHQNQIISFLTENGESKSSDIALYLGLGLSRTKKILSEMDNVKAVGNNKNRKYSLIK